MINKKKQFVSPSKILPLLLLGLTTIGLMVSVYAVQQNQDLRKQAAVPGCPPAMTSPTNGAIITTIPTSFTWSHCSSAAAYLVYLSSDANWGGHFGVEKVVPTASLTLSTAEKGSMVPGTYYMQVFSCTKSNCSDGGSGGAGPKISFTHDPNGDAIVSIPGCPVKLQTPAHGTTLTKLPQFQWSHCEMAAAYEFTITGKNTHTAVVRESRYTIPESFVSQMSGTYQWKVTMCKNQNCTQKHNQLSELMTLTYNPATYVRISLNEADQAVNHNPSAVAAYTLNTTQKITDCTPDSPLPGRTKVYRCNGLAANTTYTYKAIATGKNATIPTITSQINGKSGENQIFDLWITYANTLTVSPSKALAGETVQIAVKGKKMTSPPARLSIDGTGPGNFRITQNTTLAQGTNTFNQTYSAKLPTTAGTHKIKLIVAEAFQAQIPGSVLTYDAFVFNSTAPSPTPTQTNPTKCQPNLTAPKDPVISEPTFTWTDCKQTDKAVLMYQFKLTGTGVNITQNVPPGNSSVVKYKPADIKYTQHSSYDWTVRACTTLNCSASSLGPISHSSFTANFIPIGGGDNPCTPQISSPAQNATYTTIPRIKWTQGCMPQSLVYQLQITPGSNLSNPDHIDSFPTANTYFDLPASYTNKMNTGTYAIRVRACDFSDCSNGVRGVSNTVTFKYTKPVNTPTNTQTPTPIQPLNATLNFQIKLQGVIHAQTGRKVSMTLLPKDPYGTRKDIAAINITPTDKYNQGVYSGQTTISNLLPGTYNIYIKGNSHLQKMVATVEISNAKHTFNWATTEKQLKAGDVVGSSKNTPGNNIIRLNDITSIIEKYTALNVPVPAGTAEDVDFSGTITIRDIALTIANYNKLAVPGDTIPDSNSGRGTPPISPFVPQFPSE